MRVAILAAVLAFGLSAATATAATRTVTSKADSGNGSIRQTVLDADPGDTVAIPAGTYAVTSAAIPVGKALTLRGAGARATILRADGNNRVLSLAATTLVTVARVTLTNGSESPGGGGILSN